MRRFIAMALTAAFVAMLWPAVASARLDFRDAFAMRTFGRTPGSVASFAFVRAPLRGLAFRTTVTESAQDVVTPLAARAMPHLAPITLDYDRLFALSDPRPDFSGVVVPALSLPSYALETPLAASTVTNARPQPFSLPAVAAAVPSFASGAGDAGFAQPEADSFASQLQGSATAIDAQQRAGTFRLTGQVGGTLGDYRTRDDRLRASTAFDVRAGDARFKINVGSDYEHLDNGAAIFPYVSAKPAASFTTTSIAELPGGKAAALAPTYANVTTRGVNAGVALPLTSRLTMGVQYGTQRYTGAYGTTLQPNLDASKYSYLGNLTLSLPHSAAITLSARQYRYQDNLVPFSFSQQSADLNFSVKF